MAKLSLMPLDELLKRDPDTFEEAPPGSVHIALSHLEDRRAAYLKLSANHDRNMFLVDFVWDRVFNRPKDSPCRQFLVAWFGVTKYWLRVIRSACVDAACKHGSDVSSELTSNLRTTMLLKGGPVNKMKPQTEAGIIEMLEIYAQPKPDGTLFLQFTC
jgi:hypothetical protein